MLVITRHSGESIRVGDDIIVVVRKITAPNDSANVHLAIEAPQTIEINRAESPRKEPRATHKSNR